MGIGAGLANSFAGEIEVHIRPTGAGSNDAMKGKTSKKAIKDLQIGDEVLAFAEWKEKDASQSDTGDKLDQRIVYLTPGNSQTIEATDGWRNAILLKKGGKLLLKGSSEADSDAKWPLTAVQRARIAIESVASKSPVSSDVSTDGSSQASTEAQSERIATISSVRVEVKQIAVFNIEVANAHTFFVGDAGVLVHNGKSGMERQAWASPKFGDGKCL